MNSLAPSNLPVSSADIVVGLVGSKVQELPESPATRRRVEGFRTAGWKFQLGIIFYIDLKHHGYNHNAKHLSNSDLLVKVIM